MKTHHCLRIYTFLCLAIAAGCSLGPAAAQSPDNWMLGVSARGASIGSLIGIAPWAHDGYDSGNGRYPSPDKSALYLKCFRANGPEWNGPTGLYAGDVERTPIPAGATKTWSDFYLWAQNFTPTSANVTIIDLPTDPYLPPPAGYRGHLVLDYVPTSCNWTGPTDYWLDLTVRTELALPIPIVTDPLDGTRFHLTVHAPVPEPSCLAALAMGITAIGGCAIRRRRA